MNLDFEIRDNSELMQLRVRAAAELQQEIRDLLGEASSIALDVMRQRVPRGRQSYSRRGDPDHRPIYSSLRRGPISYAPGAAGGGGYYEIEVGALDPPEHLRYVMEGTADYPGAGNVGKVMTIQKLGEAVRYRTHRKGQQAQSDWFTDAYRAANAFIFARMQALDLFKGD